MSKEIIKESGLRMVEITEGHGDSPTTGQTVSVHYEIFFGEGTSTSNYDEKAGKYVDNLYDSTYEDKPFSGPVDIVIGAATPKDDIYSRGQSIKGFDEALVEMVVACGAVGERCQIEAPQHVLSLIVDIRRNKNCVCEAVSITHEVASSTSLRPSVVNLPETTRIRRLASIVSPHPGEVSHVDRV